MVERDGNANERKSGDELTPGPSDETVVSLSQVLLAPLNAIFKAQVHAARSFLSFVLQLSYPDKGPTPKEAVSTAVTKPDPIYMVDFIQEVSRIGPAGEQISPPLLKKISLPAIALVPLRPLAVEAAEFDLAMTVTWIGPHKQTRQAERVRSSDPSGEDRPWYLVDDPISLRGHVAPVPANDGKGEQPHIKLNVKIAPVPIPAGLEKILTTLTQSAQAGDPNPPKPQM